MSKEETAYLKEDRSSRATKVTWIGFWANVILTILKFATGIIGRSSAMIADAVHSFSDFITDLIVIFSFRIVKKPVDESHDFGHGKFETLATSLVGISLLAVALGIMWSSGKIIFDSFNGEIIDQPGFITLIAAVISIAVKETLYRYQIKVGNEIKSSALVANAWHHRSDALSSIATFFGIGGAIFLGENWRILDPIAAVIVSLLILKISIQIIWESTQELMEKSLNDEEKLEILKITKSVDGVINPHNLRTRKIGNYIAIDIHIEVDRGLNIVKAHDIADAVETRLKKSYGEDSLVYVHVDPEDHSD